VSGRPERRATRPRFRVLAQVTEVVAAIPHPALAADTRGRIRAANEAAGAALGVPLADLLGQPLGRFLPSASPAAEASTLPLRTPGGRPAGALIFLREAPAPGPSRLELEQRAAALERIVAAQSGDLRRASQAREEFLAILSHELRTPLTPILTWAQIIRQDADRSRVQQASEVIERNVRLQMALVEDLLDLMRLREGSLVLESRPEDLRSIVRGALDALAEAAAERGVSLEWRPLSLALPVEADASRLLQALRQLLGNAVKFGRSGGHVRVAITREGEAAVVRIQDDGAGIAPEFTPFIFEPFRQQEQGARREHGGLGVGLALARGLVELHGGTIDVRSEGLGRGTEVTVSLPVWQSIARPRGEGQPGGDRSVARLDGLAILVVEDSVDTAEATRLLLQDLGARVVVAKNGLEALDVLAGDEPDAVVCDLRMPGLDGFEFLRRLRADRRLGRLPVVALSGFASAGDFQRTREAGFDGHVGKPFDATALAAALQGALTGEKRGQPAA
jgi:signal transduction histidine kinase/ActR/RegA family two-component response regulator